MDADAAAMDSKPKKVRKYEISKLIYLSPVLIVLAVLNFYPIAYTIYISMTNFSGTHFYHYAFVGATNLILIIAQ